MLLILHLFSIPSLTLIMSFVKGTFPALNRLYRYVSFKKIAGHLSSYLRSESDISLRNARMVIKNMEGIQKTAFMRIIFSTFLYHFHHLLAGNYFLYFVSFIIPFLTGFLFSFKKNEGWYYLLTPISKMVFVFRSDFDFLYPFYVVHFLPNLSSISRLK